VDWKVAVHIAALLLKALLRRTSCWTRWALAWKGLG
jgi:hypothetical protein